MLVYPEKVQVPFDRTDEAKHFKWVARLSKVVERYKPGADVQTILGRFVIGHKFGFFRRGHIIAQAVARVERPSRVA